MFDIRSAVVPAVGLLEQPDGQQINADARNRNVERALAEPLAATNFRESFLEPQEIQRLRNEFRVACEDVAQRDADMQERAVALMKSSKGEACRLVVSHTAFDGADPSFSGRILREPALYMPPLDDVASVMLTEARSSGERMEGRMGITGWLGSHTVTPRGLRAHLVNCLVAVEGIVTGVTVVKPKISQTVHIADGSGRYLIREHRDENALDKVASGQANQGGVPKHDEHGNRFHIEQGMSRYRNFQSFTLQEMPEKAPSGQLPRAVQVQVDGDLVDLCKAGDRVTVWGIFKAVPGRENGVVQGYNRSFLVGNNIERIQDAIPKAPRFEDRALIQKIASMDDPLSHLCHSICPTLFGGIERKKGLLLQLVGGIQRKLEKGNLSVRGDIHILLVGDPSCGKSQLLRFMMRASNLSVSTTGRGSSGVGLTAAVTMDKDTGERRLEAGAMVMADGGLVCIDEFDKMTNEDRVAIHEVMEQQRVTIAKASIQCSLNARCKVLAAANPNYGCFDAEKDLGSQLSFPDSLLSRFDLIFLVHDASTALEDRRITRAVLSYHAVKESSSKAIVAVDQNKGGVGGEVDPHTYCVSARVEHNDEGELGVSYDIMNNTIYPIEFLKKLVSQCQGVDPDLSKEAKESIANFYTELRRRCGDGKTSSIPTARTLEACVRLSTAHARLRLSQIVEIRDVRQAKALLLHTMLGETYDDSDEEARPKDKGKARKSVSKSTDGEGPTKKRRNARPASGGESISAKVKSAIFLLMDVFHKEADEWEPEAMLARIRSDIPEAHDFKMEQFTSDIIEELTAKNKCVSLGDSIVFI